MSLGESFLSHVLLVWIVINASVILLFSFLIHIILASTLWLVQRERLRRSLHSSGHSNLSHLSTQSNTQQPALDVGIGCGGNLNYNQIMLRWWEATSCSLWRKWGNTNTFCRSSWTRQPVSFLCICMCMYTHTHAYICESAEKFVVLTLLWKAWLEEAQPSKFFYRA